MFSMNNFVTSSVSLFKDTSDGLHVAAFLCRRTSMLTLFDDYMPDFAQILKADFDAQPAVARLNDSEDV